MEVCPGQPPQGPGSPEQFQNKGMHQARGSHGGISDLGTPRGRPVHVCAGPGHSSVLIRRARTLAGLHHPRPTRSRFADCSRCDVT